MCRNFVLIVRYVVLAMLTILEIHAFAQEVSESHNSQTTITPLKNLAVSNERMQLLELSDQEWERHATLISQFRRYLSDASISPLEVLGIHAEDQISRRQYARRWARIVYEDTQRVLAFQREFDAAMKELVADQPLIDVSKLPSHSDAPELLPTDRLLLFVSQDCYLCSVAIETIVGHLVSFEAVDVYFTDVSRHDETPIQTWALDHELDASLVDSGKITLNFDNGTLERIYPRAREVPVLLRLRNGIVSPVSLSALNNELSFSTSK